MGRPCIVGCTGLVIDSDTDRAMLGSSAVSAGDWIAIDGDSGRIYLGKREIIVSRPDAELAEIEGWRSNNHGKGHGHHRTDPASQHPASH
jgi:pyruvate,orthophosphate dikinase